MVAHRIPRMPFFALSGLVLCIGGAAIVSPRWVERVGLDCWHIASVRQSLREADQRSALLEAKSEGLHRETEACKHIAMRLITDEITLEKAVTELTPLLKEREGFYSTWSIIYRAPTFRHGVARYAMLQVQSILGDEPKCLAAMTEILDAQYAAIK